MDHQSGDITCFIDGTEHRKQNTLLSLENSYWSSLVQYVNLM